MCFHPCQGGFTMSNDEILTVKETAALLKTTRQQVRKMIANEELPAFWSVGCLTRKSELFRLRFVLFTTVRSADFPLFPSSPARFFRILGQKWVRISSQVFFNAGMLFASVSHTERISIAP